MPAPVGASSSISFIGVTVTIPDAVPRSSGSDCEVTVNSKSYSPATAPGGMVAVANSVPSSSGCRAIEVGAPRMPHPVGAANSRE